jgi:aldose 1-epimerase
MRAYLILQKGRTLMLSKKLSRRKVLLSASAATALTLPSPLLTQAVASARTMQTPDLHPGSDESLPSGKQYRIQKGNTFAVVTEEGAGLREFVVNGREFLDTFSQNEISPFSNGQVLIPFPNRIDQGTYTFQGVTQQLPLSEPGNDNAIHGLTRWSNWSVTGLGSDYIQLSLILHGQPGYPFVLALKETYRVSQGTLFVTTDATNIGPSALPYGVGHHPYITVGTDLIDTDILHIPANSYFLANSRLIPEPPAVTVSGTQFDFRTPHALGTTFMDTGFADLIFDADHYSRVKLSAPGGTPAVTIFADSHHKFLQIYTGDTLSDTSARRRGLAVEPYTCASNAFNNGLGLIVLQPGESFSSTWGISVSL